MRYSTLISAVQLQALIARGDPLVVFDCSFELMKPLAGDEQFLESHIPGAVRANLDRHLSAQPGDGTASGGRHPLPTRETFAAWLGSAGFTNGIQAVVYDRQGANYCGRLWWMLKWVGHEDVRCSTVVCKPGMKPAELSPAGLAPRTNPRLSNWRPSGPRWLRRLKY